MKRTSIIMLALLISLALAGCIGGGNPSDSHDQTDSHDTTTSAVPTQNDNRPICVAIVNGASCNVIQVLDQGQADDLEIMQMLGAGCPMILVLMGIVVIGMTLTSRVGGDT